MTEAARIAEGRIAFLMRTISEEGTKPADVTEGTIGALMAFVLIANEAERAAEILEQALAMAREQARFAADVRLMRTQTLGSA